MSLPPLDGGSTPHAVMGCVMRIMGDELLEERYDLNYLHDIIAVANRLAHLCPIPELAMIGLKELLINAVEHGCLGITYQEKTQFLATDHSCWENEVTRRMALAENLGKTVFVHVQIDKEEIRFLIKDPGIGFDWQPYLQIQTGRLNHQHGRGIAIARQMSFHHLEFMGTGNEVLAVVRLEQGH